MADTSNWVVASKRGGAPSLAAQGVIVPDYNATVDLAGAVS